MKLSVRWIGWPAGRRLVIKSGPSRRERRESLSLVTHIARKVKEHATELKLHERACDAAGRGQRAFFLQHAEGERVNRTRIDVCGIVRLKLRDLSL
jgi:hypothetical protein